MTGPVYALNLFNVTDRDEYLAYSRKSATEVQAHGGRVVALGKFREATAGDIKPRAVMILVEWASKAAFDDYCNDPKLADLHPQREKGARDYVWHLLVVVRLDRRALVWINVTQNSTAEWVARQLTEAFPWDEAPGYLIGDNDQIYGELTRRRIRAMGIRDKPTAPGSPWQNGFAERLIGSIRRECLDHLVVLDEAQLRRILRSYGSLGIHPDDLPDMAVEIVKTPSEHESVIDRRPRFERARAHGRVNDFIDFGLALLGQADKHLRRFLGVGDRLAGELLEFRFRQEHRVNILRDHQTGRRRIRKFWIERIAKLRKKGLGSNEVLDGQVHENLSGHVYLQVRRPRFGDRRRRQLRRYPSGPRAA